MLARRQKLNMIKAGNLNLATYEAGNGDPVLMIVGWGSRAADLGPLRENIAEDWRVISVDNRGTGASDMDLGSYFLEDLADDCIAVLDGYEMPKAHVVGFSMGGMIAQLVALNYPERVNRLVLISTHPGGPNTIYPDESLTHSLFPYLGEGIEQFLRRMLRLLTAPSFEQNKRELFDELAGIFLAKPTGLNTLMTQLNAMSQSNRYDRLAKIMAPTLILQGRSDQLVPPENAELMAKQIPNSRIVWIEDCGHYTMWEHARETTEAVASFLSFSE